MGYYDFPHTRNYDTDLGYLIDWFNTNKNKIEENTAITIEKALSATENSIKAYNSATNASNSAELSLELKNQTEALKNQTEALKNLMQDKIDQINSNTSRINNLATIDQGSITTTADAELVDIRVGYNGITYPSAGDAVRRQITELNNDLDDLYKNVGNLVFNSVEGFYIGPANADPGTTIDFRENLEYGYSVTKVQGLEKISVSEKGTTSFSFFTDANNKVIQNGSNFVTENDGYTISVPSGSVYYYSCNTVLKNNGLVVVNGNIVPNKFDIIDKPINTSINHIYKLEASDNVNVVNGYDNLKDNTVLPYKATTFGDAIIGGNKIKVNSVNGGFATEPFESNTSKLEISFSCTYTFSNLSITMKIEKTDGSVSYKNLKVASGGQTEETIYYDCAYSNVYENAKKFSVIINCTDGAVNTGELIFNKFTLRELNGWKTNNLYDCIFSKMMENVFSEIEKSSVVSNNLVLGNANGFKYSLNVSNDGSITAIRNIPNKTLFLGNSLLLGMDPHGTHGGSFGMASTSPYKDYAYYVEQAILEKNSSAAFNKLNDAPFEMAETHSEAQNYINSNLVHFTRDLDLVIIQIGDNVNNNVRRNVFNISFKDLLNTIRTKCPNARVFVVGIWFNSATFDILKISENYGCKLIDISALNTIENQATAGETITYKDGTTEPMPSVWASHPGNNGMKAIADKIIAELDM